MTQGGDMKTLWVVAMVWLSSAARAVAEPQGCEPVPVVNVSEEERECRGRDSSLLDAYYCGWRYQLLPTERGLEKFLDAPLTVAWRGVKEKARDAVQGVKVLARLVSGRRLRACI